PSSARSTRDAPLLLLIDDRLEDLKELIALLGRHFRLALAQSGRQGLQKAAALRPALILLDGSLPDIDGFVVCEMLRAGPATCAIPVIFLSARAQADQRVEGLVSGAVDFIVKPYFPEEVLARVRVHLSLVRLPQGGAAAPDPASKDPQRTLIDVICAHIRANLADLPPVSVLAHRFGVHDKRMLALFREHLGTTVSGFISEARTLEGARLLKESLMSVQDIAFAVGFENAGNFATAFRVRHGMTPQAYRQSIHEGSSRKS
ncbi:MAG: DNA-binding response regulator, partial [Variovorax sp.]